VFADGFEAGNMGAWSSSATAGGNLDVAGSAALSGSYGLRATISNRTGMYLTDDTPSAASDYHARFQFDPNSVSMASRRVQTIFAGRSSSGNKVILVQFRSNNGTYQVRAGARQNNGSTKYSPWSSIGDAPHAVEAGWSAATTTNGTDGSVSLWVDGSLVATKTGLANGSQRVDDARLGPQVIPSGTSGVELFDGFVSTLSSYIGP
jgi:hypothetical protein